MRGTFIAGILFIVAIGGMFFFLEQSSFPIPEGETRVIKEENTQNKDNDTNTGRVSTSTNDFTENMKESSQANKNTSTSGTVARTFSRTLMETDGTKHSIPLDEIISGGPPKDGIPSIDNPKFTDTQEADVFLNADSVGLGVTTDGVARFYPYQILVWHEIVNDNTQETSLLVTYCPLCATGIVFDPRINGEPREFGVSGRLWQSNLLMYDRTGNPDTESLWSQVLGESVLGPETGTKLDILRSDTVQYGSWKQKHPDTLVLSRDTGANRNYTRNPYGGNTPIIGAQANDDRFDAKEMVFGIEVNGQFKAYPTNAIPGGETIIDTFAGETITITKSDIGEVNMSIDGKRVPFVTGFWFSWVAVHPDTSVFK